MSSFRQDINVGMLVFVGLVGSLVLLIMVLGVQAWFAYETDVILTQRYAIDQNDPLLELKGEQLANIGDPVGNGVVYGSALLDDVGELPETAGYRYADDARSQAVMPIHAAMAAFVNAHGGNATAEQMLAMDKAYVHLTNEAYADPQSFVEESDSPETPGTPEADGNGAE